MGRCNHFLFFCTAGSYTVIVDNKCISDAAAGPYISFATQYWQAFQGLWRETPCCSGFQRTQILYSIIIQIRKNC